MNSDFIDSSTICAHIRSELAQKINISTSYLSKIECGNYPKRVSLSVLIAIASGLDIELYLLLKFDDEEMSLKECT